MVFAPCLAEAIAAIEAAQAAAEAEEIIKELIHKDLNLYEICGQIMTYIQEEIWKERYSTMLSWKYST